MTLLLKSLSGQIPLQQVTGGFKSPDFPLLLMDCPRGRAETHWLLEHAAALLSSVAEEEEWVKGSWRDVKETRHNLRFKTSTHPSLPYCWVTSSSEMHVASS